MNRCPDTLPLEEISVAQVEAAGNPFQSFDPEGVVCQRARELRGEMVIAENSAQGAEHCTDLLNAAYDRLCAQRAYTVLKRFATETSRTLQDLTAVDAIEKARVTLTQTIEESNRDSDEKRELLEALPEIELLFREEFRVGVPDALPDLSSE